MSVAVSAPPVLARAAPGVAASAAQGGADLSPVPRRSSAWLLPGMLVLATAVRVVGLTRFPLEQDELYTVMESRDLFHTALQPGIEARPLYYLMQHALFWVFPATPLTLRALPLLFGLLGVAVTWYLAERVAGRVGAVVAALLVGLSPWHMYASGFARYYALVYLLDAAAVLLLLRAYERDRPADYLAALGVLAAGMATHPTFAFPLVGAVLGLHLVRPDGRWGWRWPSRRAWGGLWLPFAALLVVGYVALSVAGTRGHAWNFHGRGTLASLRLVPAMVDWMTLPVAATAVLGAVVLAARPATTAERRAGAMMVLGCGGALLLLVALSFRTDVYADYGMGMLPLVFVASGALVARITERFQPAGAAATAAAAALWIVLLLPSTVSELSTGTRFDYRPAFRQIRAQAPGVTVLTWPIVEQRQYAPELRALDLMRVAGRVDAVLAVERDLWVVASAQRYGIVGDAGGRLTDWLHTRCALRGSFERPRFDYRTYRVELYRCRSDEGVREQPVGALPR